MDGLNSFNCLHTNKNEILSNLITGDTICKKCGEILSSSPYNDGIPLYNINKSNLSKFSSDRLGKDSNIYTTQDLHTSIGKNFKNSKMKIHRLNSNSAGLNCFKKIEFICNLLFLPNKVLSLAKNMSTDFNYKIKTKKLVAKAASYVFRACEYLSVQQNLSDYSSKVPNLNEHDLYKCIKQLKKNIPKGTYSRKKEKFLNLTEKFLQKIIKKTGIKKDEIRIISHVLLYIFLFKKKINIFRKYGKFTSSKILASTIVIFVYLNNSKIIISHAKRMYVKRKNAKKIYYFFKEFLTLIKKYKSNILKQKVNIIKKKMLMELFNKKT